MAVSLRLAMSCFVLLNLSVAHIHAGTVISRFDTNADGWTTFNDADAEYSSTIGNPAGSFRGIDRVNSLVWYFNAPTKFLGDQSSNYGEMLTYDIRLSHYNPVNEVAGDVVIRGDGLELKWRGANHVANLWTTQSVRLDTTAGWERVSDEVLATQAEILSVLSNLQFLHIRGEYRSGADNAYLDNVILGPTAVPEPGSMRLVVWAVGSVGVWGIYRRRYSNPKR